MDNYSAGCRDEGEEVTNWQKLVERYADGKPICNCRNAYTSPTGNGFAWNEEHGALLYKTDLLECKHGCSANQIAAKEYIAGRIIAELEGKK